MNYELCIKHYELCIMNYALSIVHYELILKFLSINQKKCLHYFVVNKKYINL